MIAVLPETARDRPKESSVAPSLAVSSACCSTQLVPLNAKRYTAPCNACDATVLLDAPISAVLPASATETPNASPGAPSLAASSAVWTQPVPLNEKTYTAPCSFWPPKALPTAPTSAVLPTTVSELPKSSPAAP